MKKLLLLILFITPNIFMGQNQNSAPPVEETFFDVARPYVEKILKGAEDGAEFLVTEAPMLIRQYVMFHAVYNSTLVMLSLFFIFFSTHLANWWFTVKGTKDEDGVYQVNDDNKLYSRINKKRFIVTGATEWSGEQVFYFFVRWGLRVVGVIMFFVNIMDAIKTVFFPKLFLVEKFIELGKGVF
jgi:hypothetical protein